MVLLAILFYNVLLITQTLLSLQIACGSEHNLAIVGKCNVSQMNNVRFANIRFECCNIYLGYKINILQIAIDCHGHFPGFKCS